ncbi:DUF423 domain-containing protein [filamentous cyanobacterium LEGE 11480]|uniref:DUF423 domain-containing protein n=1 Tax=Romeriopsis navalis LEGE 11480 TaxID=2777977 RepID=A0A928Z0J4_9CYAN|nr:DUF423 domain-containing protein [Romeriopsis navalis]MBE9028336.1 DUF423 domain-containing protein [Romeriopsis navalis LEGE 11480]
MPQFFISAAAVLAGLAVGLGAFASHGLKTRLDNHALDIFETGARYQMYHALALLCVGILISRATIPSNLLDITGCAFILGIFIFSGSLYVLSLTGIKILGAITPIGGAAFLIGWGCLAIAGWSYK